MKPSEILDSAANIILRDGWAQGAYFKEEACFGIHAQQTANKTAPCCQDGAISRATWGWAWMGGNPNVHRERTPETTRARARANRFMKEYIRSTGWTDDSYVGVSAIAWNDHPGRTREEVVEAFRRAADLAREAGE